jgi:hypothetical protein
MALATKKKPAVPPRIPAVASKRKRREEKSSPFRNNGEVDAEIDDDISLGDIVDCPLTVTEGTGAILRVCVRKRVGSSNGPLARVSIVPCVPSESWQAEFWEADGFFPSRFCLNSSHCESILGENHGEVVLCFPAFEFVSSTPAEGGSSSSGLVVAGRGSRPLHSATRTRDHGASSPGLALPDKSLNDGVKAALTG